MRVQASGGAETRHLRHGEQPSTRKFERTASRTEERIAPGKHKDACKSRGVADGNAETGEQKSLARARAKQQATYTEQRGLKRENATDHWITDRRCALP